MFGEIEARHATSTHDPAGLLSLLLASLVYHSTCLCTIATKYPRHQFMFLAILNEPELLDSLKDHVTLEPNDNVPYATGVLPHVDHVQALANFLEACEGLDLKLEAMSSSFEEAIHSAINKKVNMKSV